MTKQYTKIIGSIKDFHNELQALRYAMEVNMKPYVKQETIETQCEILIARGGFIWNISTITENPMENFVVYYGSWVNNQFLVYSYPLNNPVSYINHSLGLFDSMDYENPKIYYPTPDMLNAGKPIDPKPPSAA